MTCRTQFCILKRIAIEYIELIESRLDVKIISSDLDNLWGVMGSVVFTFSAHHRGKRTSKMRLFKKSQPPQSLKDVLFCPKISKELQYLEKKKTIFEQNTKYYVCLRGHLTNSHAIQDAGRLFLVQSIFKPQEYHTPTAC